MAKIIYETSEISDSVYRIRKENRILDQLCRNLELASLESGNPALLLDPVRELQEDLNRTGQTLERFSDLISECEAECLEQLELAAGMAKQLRGNF